jgi:hypothetical protein
MQKKHVTKGRRQMMKAFYLAITLALFSQNAFCQDKLYPDYYTKGKPGMLHGQGGRSCGTFIADENTPLHFQDVAWAVGFLDAIDQWNPYTVANYDYNGLALWLDEYCKQHPIDVVENASLAFYKYIGGREPMSQDPTLWRHFFR